jgi:2,3-bisphosphoglycerate-independent phosphoglycerate mutase
MAKHSDTPRPVVLCVLDGWGWRTETDGNAIAQAPTPNWDAMVAHGPMGLLDASAHEVGLPEGQMGNSEVGHMNLGAGRVVMQDLPRIDQAIADGELAENQTLLRFIDRLKRSGGTCHLMGLVSPGGVHSHQKQIAALARIVAGAGVPVRIHAFLDGRDTPPRSADGYIANLLADIGGQATVATVCGRYFAMDRDKRWDRVARAYDMLMDAEGTRAPDAEAAVAAAYAEGEDDEFVTPRIVGDYAGMADGDGVLMANFRADRVREILTALLDPAFDGFARMRVVKFAAAAGMTEYSEALNPFLLTLFPPGELRDTLGEIVATAGLKQLRIAETEKYAHVTFFLNGGEEKQYPGEERILVPSPKVATYDLQPEMSAPEVTDKLVAAIADGRFDLIVVNYANGDMVGHTGKLDAAMQAAAAVDACLGRLAKAVTKAGGVLLITADHGNAENMHDPTTGQPHTAHTMNVVPAVLVNAPAGIAGLRRGRLADVAPTLLALMHLPQPQAMTGQSLLRTAADSPHAADQTVAAQA